MVAIKEWAGAVGIMETGSATVLENARLIIGRRIINAAEILDNSNTLICIVLAIPALPGIVITIPLGAIIQIAAATTGLILILVLALCSNACTFTAAVPAPIVTAMVLGRTGQIAVLAIGKTVINVLVIQFSVFTATKAVLAVLATITLAGHIGRLAAEPIFVLVAAAYWTQLRLVFHILPYRQPAGSILTQFGLGQLLIQVLE